MHTARRASSKRRAAATVLRGLRVAVTLAAIAAGSALATGTAHAQAWPAKTVTIVSPYPAGGITDRLSRIVAEELAKALGQPFVVENRTGAGGAIAMGLVAKAAPDGYTLLMASTNNAVNMTLFRKMPYDTARDFAPVSLVAMVPNILIAHPSVPARTVQELVGYVRANPDKLIYASAGNGSPAHLAAEKFNRAAGISIRGVPYKGAAPAVSDLLAGHVHLMLTNIAASQAHIQAGKLRAIAVAGSNRSPVFPDLPTIAESGYPGFEASAWYGIVAPAGTPAPIVERLHAELVRALKTDESLGVMRRRGTDPVVSTPAEMAARIREDIASYGDLIRQAGITTQ